MKKIVISILVGLVFFSCKKKVDSNDKNVTTSTPDVHQIKVSVEPVLGNESMQLDNVYTTPNGDKIKFTLFKFLMEDIKVGGKAYESALFNYSNGKDLFSIEAKPNENEAFSTNLGVDSTLNHINPTEFSTENALNILNAGDMHWAWNPGYIFFKIEAKMDTINDGVDNFDHFVTYHIGKDANLRTLNLSNLNWQTSGTNHNLVLKFDFEKFMSNGNSVIDLRAENNSHSGPSHIDLSAKVANNFRDAFSN